MGIDSWPRAFVCRDKEPLETKFMSHIENNLLPGEALIYRTGCHWVVMFWPFAGGIVLGFFGFAFFVSGWLATRHGGSYQGAMVVGGIGLLAAIGLIGGGVIRRAATEVGVSNTRVLIKTGLFSERSIEVLLPKVESIGITQSVFGRVLGYGTVVVRGTGGTFETFDKIRQPAEFRRQVQAQIASTR